MTQLRSLLALACCLLATSARADDWVTYPAKDGPGKGKHIVFLAGDEEYRSEEGLPMLAKILSQRDGFKCTVLFSLDKDGFIDPDKGGSLGASHMLDSADGIVMLLRYRAWPDADMKHFVDAYQRGVPIIGLRTSTHAFRYPGNSSSIYKSYTNFGKKVFGEGWVNHWGPNRKGATRGILPTDNVKRPILNGVTDIFGDSGVYEVYPPSDVDILVRGQVLKGMQPTDPPADYKKKRNTDKMEQGVNDPMMAVAWSRIHKNDAGRDNRVFCTTMGAATDLLSEGLRRLVVNAVFWGFNLEVPAKADVGFIGEFKPTAYGTKIYKKGVKPADLAITPADLQEKKTENTKVEHTKDSLDTIKTRLADKKAVLIDVREQTEWDAGHLKDAKLLPLSKINEKDKAAELTKVLPKDQIIYLHCGSGKRCVTAATELQKLGYDARPLKEGFNALVKAGFEKAAK